MWLVLGLVGAAAIAVVGPLSNAVGFFSRGLSLGVTVQSPASITAKGAGLVVPLSVTCTGSFADLNVQVTERVGSVVTQGSGYASVPCVGGIQQMKLTVTPAGGKAFKKGSAVVQAQIFGCNNQICGSDSATATVDVSQK
jgi:hypothetical protein